jgi:hypothetical protein
MRLSWGQILTFCSLLATGLWGFLVYHTRPKPPPPPPQPTAAESATVRLDPKLLAPVRARGKDLRSWGLEAEEGDAYYAALEKARDVPLATQKKVARAFAYERRRAFRPGKKHPSYRQFAKFADMYFDPFAWQGQPVTFHGRVRRIDESVEEDNEYGLERLYQVQIFPDDSQNNPVIAFCIELPKGIKPGTQNIDDASVTGYFFKWYGYQAEKDNRYAPLILAQRLEIEEPAEERDDRISLTTAVGLIAAILFLAGISVLFTNRDRRIRREREASRLENEPPDFSQLDG